MLDEVDVLEVDPFWNLTMEFLGLKAFEWSSGRKRTFRDSKARSTECLVNARKTSSSDHLFHEVSFCLTIHVFKLDRNLWTDLGSPRFFFCAIVF